MVELSILERNLKSEKIIHFYLLFLKAILIKTAMLCFGFLLFPVSSYPTGGTHLFQMPVLYCIVYSLQGERPSVRSHDVCGIYPYTEYHKGED